MKSKLMSSGLDAFKEFELRNTHQVKGGYVVCTNTDPGSNYPKGDNVEHTYSDTDGSFLRTDGYGGGPCCDVRYIDPLHPTGPTINPLLPPFNSMEANPYYGYPAGVCTP